MPKKRSSKKKSSKKELKKKKPALHAETKKGILAIVSFTLAVLSVLSFFNGAGAFGRYFLKFSQLLFGRGFFLISVSFVLIGLTILMPRQKRTIGAILLGVLLFILSVLGIFQVLGHEGNNGGYLGLAFGYPLEGFLGFGASLIVLLALLIISFLITFNLSLWPASPARQDEKEEEEKPIAEPEKKIGLFGKLKEKAKEIKSVKEVADLPVEEKDQLVGREDLQESKTKDNAVASLAADQVNRVKQIGNFKLPTLDYLEKDKGQPTSGDIKANLNIIKKTLENFGIEVEMAEVNIGPTVTQYTLRPAQGVKLTKIITLQNDLALALAAHPLRIEAPIPGRPLVGIEIPNRSMVLVRLRTLLERPTFQESTGGLTFALGRDVAGHPIFANLARMPHLLVAGATGTGKTVALNSIITSLLYRNSPQDMKLILIDPKRVELTAYNSIPHLITPVIVQSDKATGALRWTVSEMERRFKVLQEAGRRDIDSYNKKSEERLPYIVLVIDELADLMSTYGREVEASIVRLAQMARAVGIHLIVSTQRPSVEVITGLIKANITSRVAFQVASQIDSRTILDMAGAEKLLGNGDMLFLAGNSAKPKRIQGGFISDQEIKKVTDYLRSTGPPDFLEGVTETEHRSVHPVSNGENEDELLGEAKEVVTRAKKASASLLQRRLRVGYARAARLLDIMEEQGIVGPADGAKPREVFIDEGADMKIE